MIEIWVEFARFKTISQRFAGQVRIQIKKVWFSDLEILEIHQQIHRETYQQAPNRVTETLNTEKPETSSQRRTLSNRVRNTITEQTLTEEKEKSELWRKFCLKRRLPSLRNQDGKIVKTEIEKINDLLTNITTNIITELNEQIYSGAKFVCEKNGVLLKKMNRNSKPERKIRMETHLRNLRQQAKMLR